jgi:hypothetical protein
METLLHSTTVPVPRHGDSVSAHDRRAIITPTSSVGSFLQDVSIPQVRKESGGSVDGSRQAAPSHREDWDRSESQSHFEGNYWQDEPQSMDATNRESPRIMSPPHVDYSLLARPVRSQPEDSYCTPNDKEEIAISPEEVGASIYHCRQ